MVVCAHTIWFVHGLKKERKEMNSLIRFSIFFYIGIFNPINRINCNKVF